MATTQSFQGRRVTVAGLGRFGGQIAAARWLVEQGARVCVTDQQPAERLAESIRQLDGVAVEFRLGGHVESDFTGCDLVVASPAIPPGSPWLSMAARAGVPVTTEICLVVERLPCPVVGVTGTKGKSTTTALLGRMLERRRRVHVGGNIGRSLLSDLPAIGRDDLAVLELSSFMLHYLGALRFAPRVALVTMVTADHLEWHGGLDAYVEAKRQIVRWQSGDDVAVLNDADPTSRRLAESAGGQVRWFGSAARPALPLRIAGAHNQLNAQGALEAARVFGATFDDACAAVADFAGLPHRLQIVHEAGGVLWVNDSIATIPEAAAAACAAYPPGRVLQIVGGYDKKLDMAALPAALAPRCRAVLTIGELGPSLAARVSAAGGVAVECGTLERAVAQARALATPGDVVLLSPGCASYDQFANFEQRGAEFARLAATA